MDVRERRDKPGKVRYAVKLYQRQLEVVDATAVSPVALQHRALEGQGRHSLSAEGKPVISHRPRAQVRKSGKDMDGNDIEQADIALGAAFGNRDSQGDFVDEREEPRVCVEEVAGSFHLFHSLDGDAVKEMVASTGQERGAC